MGAPKFTPEERELIRADYEDGLPVRDIAEKWGCAFQYPSALQRRAGGMRRRKRNRWPGDSILWKADLLRPRVVVFKKGQPPRPKPKRKRKPPPKPAKPILFRYAGFDPTEAHHF